MKRTIYLDYLFRVKASNGDFTFYKYTLDVDLVKDDYEMIWFYDLPSGDRLMFEDTTDKFEIEDALRNILGENELSVEWL